MGDDPRRDFPASENRTPLDFLERQAAPGPALDRDYAIDSFELHTHPDLTERLKNVAGKQRVLLRPAYGCPLIVAPTGVAFALAHGQRLLAFRLPTETRDLAREMGAVERPDLGEGWFGFDAWAPDVPMKKHLGDLAYFCEEAHRHALGPGSAERRSPRTRSS